MMLAFLPANANDAGLAVPGIPQSVQLMLMMLSFMALTAQAIQLMLLMLMLAFLTLSAGDPGDGHCWLVQLVLMMLALRWPSFHGQSS